MMRQKTFASGLGLQNNGEKYPAVPAVSAKRLR